MYIVDVVIFYIFTCMNLLTIWIGANNKPNDNDKYLFARCIRLVFYFPCVQLPTNISRFDIINIKKQETTIRLCKCNDPLTYQRKRVFSSNVDIT
jgi:hypothetical protein